MYSAEKSALVQSTYPVVVPGYRKASVLCLRQGLCCAHFQDRQHLLTQVAQEVQKSLDGVAQHMATTNVWIYSNQAIFLG